ncbi:MAG: biotin--[acetyl-CoA-carboxylase] ligase [Lachnospiraceae bacterium]|nr:biotin--[acetyl-CoA-carboxylase] ligase [Lachnospiraceae bacterium]
MTVAEQVLIELEENKGKPISGEELAEKLGCSRNAVWKAVKALENEGYEVVGIRNKGYTLKTSADGLSSAYIEAKLQKAGVKLALETYKSIDSTNSLLKRYAAEGESRDMVAVAEEQTAGRGRRGRSFFSPKGSGLYMSFLLHPDVPIAEATSLTTVAAVAEANAIERVTGFETGIKWVNDIWMRGKKVSGILTEAQTSIESGTLDYCVVGIGINLYEPECGFPEEIRDVAGAVYTENLKRENLKNDLAAALIEEFMSFYEKFPNKAYLEDYKKRCFCIGRDVTVVTSDHKALETDKSAPDRVHAHVLGVDENCHLHVRYKDGAEGFLSSGEISIRL